MNAIFLDYSIQMVSRKKCVSRRTSRRQSRMGLSRKGASKFSKKVSKKSSKRIASRRRSSKRGGMIRVQIGGEDIPGYTEEDKTTNIVPNIDTITDKCTRLDKNNNSVNINTEDNKKLADFLGQKPPVKLNLVIKDENDNTIFGNNADIKSVFDSYKSTMLTNYSNYAEILNDIRKCIPRAKKQESDDYDGYNGYMDMID